jgi:hypothetical protein
LVGSASASYFKSFSCSFDRSNSSFVKGTFTLTLTFTTNAAWSGVQAQAVPQHNILLSFYRSGIQLLTNTTLTFGAHSQRMQLGQVCKHKLCHSIIFFFRFIAADSSY